MWSSLTNISFPRFLYVVRGISQILTSLRKLGKLISQIPTSPRSCSSFIFSTLRIFISLKENFKRHYKSASILQGGGRKKKVEVGIVF